MSQGWVAYYRVSTAAQAVSRLGLDAQREAVTAYVRQAGGGLGAEFVEVESGGKARRPQLLKAIDRCKETGERLVIARLDRLARNLLLIAQLMDARIEFVAADMPTASKLTIHLIAAIAEYERDLISARTKESLIEYKRRGGVLGNPRLAQARETATIVAAQRADKFAMSLCSHVSMLENAGINTPTLMARKLNEFRIPTQRGSTWTPAGVRNVVRRLAKLQASTIAMRTIK